MRGVRVFGGSETGCVELNDGSKFGLVDRFSRLGDVLRRRERKRLLELECGQLGDGLVRWHRFWQRERERERCLFGAGLIPVFGECWCVVARLGF